MSLFTFVPFVLLFVAFSSAQNANIGSKEGLRNDDTIYLITTPQVYSNNEENVCVVFFKKYFESATEINVQLKSPISRKTIYETKKPLATLSECLTVSLSKVITEHVLVQVLIGNVINDTRLVSVRQRSSFTLIETPKNTYEPGEEIEFRLFSFNQWLKPVEEDFEVIWIEDSSFVPVMQWTNVLNSKGLLSYKLQLSEDCNVGLWRIKSLSKSEKLTEKTFTVNRVVKERIKINVKNAKYLLPSEAERILDVCIENEFGYPLKGELDTLVGYRRALLQHIDHSLPYYTNTFQVNDDGCVKINLNKTVLQWNEVTKNLNLQTLNVFIEFMENKTGFTESKNVEIIVAQQPIRIAYPSPSLVHHYFKPGLPYFTYFIAEHPDFTPAENEEFNVCFNIRVIPWIESDKEICKIVTSNADGIILLDIPAMKVDVSQILVRITSARFEDVANVVVLESWFSKSYISMAIKPLHESICTGPLNLEVFISNDTSAEKTLYYQFVGPNSLQTPVTVKLSMQPYSHPMPEGEDQSVKAGEQPLPSVKRGVLSIPLPSSLPPYSILDRIVLYFVDERNKLVTDSTAFFVDCLKQANIQMKMKYENSNKVEVQLENKPDDSICVVDVSSHEKRKELTKRRMMHLLEAFEVVSMPDRCQKEKVEQTLRRNAPFPQNMLTPALIQPVIDFHSAWDSFNDIGLYVSSNTVIDESPCEKDLFRNGVAPNIVQEFQNHRQIMGLRFSKSSMNVALLRRLEGEVVDDVLHSSLLLSPKTSLNAEISRKTYGNAICVSKTDGIRFVDKHLDAPIEVPIKLFVELPTKILSAEEIPVNIYIQKEVDGCVPVQITVENSQKYAIKQLPPPQCVCKDSLVTAVLKPKVFGKLLVQVTAKAAPVSANFACNDVKTSTFSPVSKSGSVKVTPPGIYNKEYDTNVYCSKDKLPFTLKKTASTKKATITTDLTYYITLNLKEQNSNPSIFDLLPRIAFVAYAVNSPNVKISDSVKQSLQKELANEYQELLNYRLPDGSFTITRRKDLHSGVAFTTEAFKTMTEFRKAYLKPIREIELQRTIQWIYSTQQRDGCFYRDISTINVWPNNLDSTLQTTAFVTASLLESGLNTSSLAPDQRKPLDLALKCIRSQLLLGEYSNLTLAILAYLNSLNGDTAEANKRLNELVGHAVVSDDQMYWNSENSKELASYAILAFLKVKDNEKAIKVSRWLVQQPNPFQSSVSSAALIEISPLFSTSSNLKFKLNNKNAVAFATAVTQNIPLAGDVSAELEGKGCAILHVDKVDKFTDENKTYFDITVDRLGDGFSTCRKRLLSFCVQEIGKQRFNTSIIKVNYASGFVVDEKALIPRLTSRNVVADFKIRDSYLLIYLRPFYNVPEPECFDIPFNQRQIIPKLGPAYIQAYDYYEKRSASNHFTDVVKYSFPNECNVTRELSHTKTLRSENSQPLRRMGEDRFDSLESRVFDCPPGVKDSCPDCRSSYQNQYNSICSSSLAAVVDRSSLKIPLFQPFMTYEHPAIGRRENKKCVAIPLRIIKILQLDKAARLAIDHSKTLNFFMLEECKCEFVTKQSKGEGLTIVDNWQHRLNAKVNLIQLSEKDSLINLPLGESKFPKC